MTNDEYKIYFKGEEEGFRKGVRAGREMMWTEIRKEDEARVRDEMYKRLPADDKWDQDLCVFFPWDDEKGCVIRELASLGRNATDQKQPLIPPRRY